jgi:polysaccharide pyruvyl transferase WcaK-like protein
MQPKRDIVLNRYAGLLKATRGLLGMRSKTDPDFSTLVLPPSVPGSLGDEAMVVATLRVLQELGATRIGLIGYAPDLEWTTVDVPHTVIDCSDYFESGSWQSEARFLRRARRYHHFLSIGADVMDGYYSDFRTLQRLRLVAQAAKTGAQTTILGFSFNAHPTSATIEALRGLPPTVRLCARDPVSQRRLLHQLARPVDLVADLAFLLPPDTTSTNVAQIAAWIAKERRADRVVLGINANYLHLRALETKDPAALVAAYVRMLSGLHALRPNLSFVLIPHDSRGKHCDIFLAESIREALPATIQRHTLKIPMPCTAAEIKGICSELDLALSARMHVAIACLGTGTPVACITYQGKFEGLFEHFALDAMALSPQEAFSNGKMSQFLLPLLEHRADLRARIAARGPYVQDLARRNFLQPTSRMGKEV